MENNTTAQIIPSTENGAAKKIAYAIYFLYLAAIVLPTLLIVGIVLSYVFQNDGKDILKSHYQYLIRTFWIGLLYFGISALLVSVVIGMLLIPVSILWWIIRLAIGLKALLHQEPILNPTTWGF